jgi:hypothetical protein
MQNLFSAFWIIDNKWSGCFWFPHFIPHYLPSVGFRIAWYFAVAWAWCNIQILAKITSIALLLYFWFFCNVMSYVCCSSVDVLSYFWLIYVQPLTDVCNSLFLYICFTILFICQKMRKGNFGHFSKITINDIFIYDTIQWRKWKAS